MTGLAIKQIGYVVRDLEEASGHWLGKTGCGPLMIMRDVEFEGWSFRGHPQSVQFDIAFGQLGDMMVEFIQPHGEWPNVYGKAPPQASCSLHHHGFLVVNPELAGKALDSELVTAASISETAQLRYYDCRDTLGIFIELISDTAETRAFFDLSEGAARDWDGTTDPLRTIAFKSA